MKVKVIGELDKTVLYQNHISTSDALVTTDQLDFSPIVFHISEKTAMLSRSSELWRGTFCIEWGDNRCPEK